MNVVIGTVIGVISAGGITVLGIAGIQWVYEDMVKPGPGEHLRCDVPYDRASYEIPSDRSECARGETA